MARAKAEHSLGFPALEQSLVSCQTNRPLREELRQGFRAVARLTFVLSKVSKTVFAGRDPPHEAAAVPCASRTTGHAAQTRCAQTWAALRPRRPAMLGSLYGSGEIKAKAKAKAKD